MILVLHLYHVDEKIYVPKILMERLHSLYLNIASFMFLAMKRILKGTAFVVSV